MWCPTLLHMVADACRMLYSRCSPERCVFCCASRTDYRESPCVRPTWDQPPAAVRWTDSAVQFLKKTMGVTEDDPRKELKDELKHLFGKLCGKLDALCNFHYTPKAAIPEMKVGQPCVSVGQKESLWNECRAFMRLMTRSSAKGAFSTSGLIPIGSSCALFLVCTHKICG